MAIYNDPESMGWFSKHIAIDPSYKYPDYQLVQNYTSFGYTDYDVATSKAVQSVQEQELELKKYLIPCASLTCNARADVFRLSRGREGVIGFCVVHDPRSLWLPRVQDIDLGPAHKFLSISDALEIVDRATLSQFSLGLVTEIVYTENPTMSIVLSGSRISYTYYQINRIVKQTSRLHVQLLDVCTPYKLAPNYSFDRLFKTMAPPKRASRNTNLVSKFGEFGTQAIL